MICRGRKGGLHLIAWVLVATVGLALPVGAETINYRLKWLYNMSVAGDLYALEEGFFRDEGLDVDVKAGGPERDAIKELELGYAKFGVASADQVIRARAKGAHVVVLAQLFQINPLQWIYRPDVVTLNSLADLRGQTIGVTFGGNDETIMKTLLAMGQIAEKEVELFSVRYDYTPFYQRKVHIWPVYRNSQGIFVGQKLRDAGEPVGVFNPEAHGVKFVANSVVTSEKVLANEPDLVRSFMRALLKGWGRAFDPANADKTIAIVKKFDKDTDLGVIAEQYRVTRGLVHPDPNIPIGTIDPDGWQQTERIMVAQGVVAKPVAILSHLKQH
ncbi:MAG: ABC transporter substrate-binding protein [Desulfosarcinaceae bacterium]|nr:ABC transporter substrate-binding protein [Desulfosarcinaceae bacterium]